MDFTFTFRAAGFRPTEDFPLKFPSNFLNEKEENFIFSHQRLFAYCFSFRASSFFSRENSPSENFFSVSLLIFAFRVSFRFCAFWAAKEKNCRMESPKKIQIMDPFLDESVSSLELLWWFFFNPHGEFVFDLCFVLWNWKPHGGFDHEFIPQKKEENFKEMMNKQDHEMQKMSFSVGTTTNQYKKKSPQRPSIVSNYSFVSLSEVTEGSLQVWRTLPEKIRQDPSLASFRQEHERLHGECSNIRFIFSSTTWSLWRCRRFILLKRFIATC